MLSLVVGAGACFNPCMAKRTTSLPSPLLVIGGGRMGAALAEGWVHAGLAAKQIHIVESDAARRKALTAQGFKTYASLPDMRPAVTLLAIKPQGLAGFAKDLKQWYAMHPPHPVISILAGITRKRLQQVFGREGLVIRAMPNTPALVGEGVTAFICARKAEAYAPMTLQLLGVVGDVLQVKDEAMMDAVTAVSGSGPAYVFHFLEALVAAAEAEGMPRAIATPLALQTVYGSVLLAMESDASFAELRQQVTSPGGTTEAALKQLMKKSGGLETLMAKAVAAASARSLALSEA